VGVKILFVGKDAKMKFSCPNSECGQHLEVDDAEMAGARYICPRCGQPIEFENEPTPLSDTAISVSAASDDPSAKILGVNGVGG